MQFWFLVAPTSLLPLPSLSHHSFPRFLLQDPVEHQLFGPRWAPPDGVYTSFLQVASLLPRTLAEREDISCVAYDPDTAL